MKTLLKLKVSYILVWAFTGLTAQEINNPWLPLTTASNSPNYKIPGKQYYYKYVPDGSEFLYNDWRKGYVILENNDRYDSLSIKYNSFKDEVIIFNTRINEMIMADKDATAGFGFYEGENRALSFKKTYYDKPPKGNYFFNTLYEGKLKLMVWYQTVEKETLMYKDANTGIMYNKRLELTKNYYLAFPDKRIERFTPSQRSFTRFFPEQKKEVRRLFRRNHVVFSSDEEIARAVGLVETELLPDEKTAGFW